MSNFTEKDARLVGLLARSIYDPAVLYEGDGDPEKLETAALTLATRLRAASEGAGQVVPLSTGGLGVILAALAEEAGGELGFSLSTFLRIYEDVADYEMEAEEEGTRGVVRVRRKGADDE